MYMIYDECALLFDVDWECACYLMLIEIVKTLIIIDRYWSTDGMLIYWYMEGCTELVCWDPWQFGWLGFYGIASVCSTPPFFMGKSKPPGHDLDCQRVTIQMSGKNMKKPRLRGSRASSTKAKNLWSQTSMGSGSAFQPGAWMRLGGGGDFRGSLGCPLEWHWVMQFLWKNSTGTIPAIFKLYGSMGFKQPQKKPDLYAWTVTWCCRCITWSSDCRFLVCQWACPGQF